MPAGPAFIPVPPLRRPTAMYDLLQDRAAGRVQFRRSAKPDTSGPVTVLATQTALGTGSLPVRKNINPNSDWSTRRMPYTDWTTRRIHEGYVFQNRPYLDDPDGGPPMQIEHPFFQAQNPNIIRQALSYYVPNPDDLTLSMDPQTLQDDLVGFRTSWSRASEDDPYVAEALPMSQSDQRQVERFWQSLKTDPENPSYGIRPHPSYLFHK